MRQGVELVPVPGSPIAFSIGSWSVRWYSLLVSVALAIALLLASRELRRRSLDDTFILDAMLWALPAGIIGARLYYVFFHWDIYRQIPHKIVAIWEGGIAIHGALFAAIPVAWIYARRRKILFLPYLDVALPCFALAQAIGRWGNWFNQEAYGSATDLPWGMVIQGVAYHPAFLYESLWDLALFGVLWSILKNTKQQEGFVASAYVFGYSLGRLWIEELRTDSEWLGPFKAASVWSVLGILIGGVLLYSMLRRRRDESSQGAL